MAQDNFIDIFDHGVDDRENGEDEGTLKTVIKNEELTLKDDRKLIGEKKVIEGESFILKLHEKDNVIDNIEIECKCGRTATIQLEYQNPDHGDELEFEDSLEKRIETEQNSPSEEPVDLETNESGIEADEVREAQFKDESSAQDSSPDDSKIEQDEHGSDLEEENEEFREGIPAAVISSQSDPETSQNSEKVQNTPD